MTQNEEATDPVPSEQTPVLLDDASAQSLLLLPSASFFCHKIELPSGIEESEIASLLELELEEISPYPEDKIYWGYWVDAEHNAALIYISLRPPIESLIPADMASYSLILPDFIPYLQERYASQTIRWIRHQNNLIGCYYEKAGRIPDCLIASPLPEGADPSEQETALKKIIRRYYPQTPQHSVNHLQQNMQVRSAPNSSFLFQSSPEDSPPYLFSDIELLTADIRESSFVRQESKRRRRAQKLWLLLQGSGALIALLLLLQIILWFNQSRLHSKEQQLADNTPEQKIIESQQQLIFSLQRASAELTEPFVILSRINELRPPSIYFTDARYDEEGTMSVDANANTVEEVNRYEKELIGKTELGTINFGRVERRQDRVFFRITLKQSPINS